VIRRLLGRSAEANVVKEWLWGHNVRMSRPEERTGESVIEKTGTKAKEPPLFRVLLHNDNYTTMEFVVDVLESVFSKPHEEALRIMLSVHQQGHGVCGVYPYEIAETKVAIVHELAQGHGFPLRASFEEV
jgi:ATP-dependent Clp protease adaptor protein ClpS